MYDTLAWDIMSGFVLGVVCLLLAKDLLAAMKGQSVDDDNIALALFCAMILVGIGGSMISWSVIQFPKMFMVVVL